MSIGMLGLPVVVVQPVGVPFLPALNWVVLAAAALLGFAGWMFLVLCAKALASRRRQGSPRLAQYNWFRMSVMAVDDPIPDPQKHWTRGSVIAPFVWFALTLALWGMLVAGASRSAVPHDGRDSVFLLWSGWYAPALIGAAVGGAVGVVTWAVATARMRSRLQAKNDRDDQGD